MNDRKFNFNAGPSTLPLSVLQEIARDMVCLPGAGVSILELGHRTNLFKQMTYDACQRVRKIFGLDDRFEVFFLQGGGRLMFSLIPMNFQVDAEKSPGYLLSGSWGQKAYDEAVQTCGYQSKADGLEKFHPVWTDRESEFRSLPIEGGLELPNNLSYLHLTSNETIQGVQLKRSIRKEVSSDVPIIADMSSDIMSRKINRNEFDLIYACVQKNLGPAGATLVIAKKSLLERCSDKLPGYCNLQNHAKHQSMYNTPPVFAIYVTGLVLKWFQKEFGTLEKVQEFSESKAKLVYDVIDKFPSVFHGHANREFRSDMNVTFRLADENVEQKFLNEAAEKNLCAMKGHRSVGGIRASLYNAMPYSGAEKLAAFMMDFASRQVGNG